MTNTFSKATSLRILIAALLVPFVTISQPAIQHDLNYEELATTWDEGFPLGNGMIGCLVWQKASNLRLSLDRADLWDLRPMKGLHRPEFRYKWIQDQVKKKDYGIVQRYFDTPYEKEPAPSKIPGGALEFPIGDWGPVESARLSLKEAVTYIRWENGTTLETFVHATHPVGWFRFTNVDKNFVPEIIPPRYEGAVMSAGGSVEGDDLSRLGYTQGQVRKRKNTITYDQEGWGGFRYQISVSWKRSHRNTIEGVWSISSHYPQKKSQPSSENTTQESLSRGYNYDLATHAAWWNKYWSQSSIRIPNAPLEKQWYLEQYKFGSTSRRGAPPISLQAVWTADNGRIPPWKGDFHHDLNTQLSYWPCYSGNHLEEGLAYFDHLEENKPNYERYTKLFFEKEGLAVPGVTTLEGTEMGGWTQYSLSPTVSSWLAHHYYLHWRYSMDRNFLKDRAYPWIRDVARFLEGIMIKDKSGFRKIPLGSSPEIHNNDITAWFEEPTNYDVALLRFTFSAASELASELGLRDDAIRWEQVLNELPDYAINQNDELMFSPSLPYQESHRHFSHLMAIHPLGLMRWEDGQQSQTVIKNSLSLLEKVGPDWWCGYSYSWLANLRARAKDGQRAAEALEIFAKAFCLKNSFHVNGDQTSSGYSKFTYRPFTLEGNFAFASGLQEMLLQSYAGFIEVMPAVPDLWEEISFDGLRAEGAFIVSARRAAGYIDEVKILSEQGGTARLKLPFDSWTTEMTKGTVVKELPGLLEITFDKGAFMTLTREIK